MFWVWIPSENSHLRRDHFMVGMGEKGRACSPCPDNFAVCRNAPWIADVMGPAVLQELCCGYVLIWANLQNIATLCDGEHYDKPAGFVWARVLEYLGVTTRVHI